MLTKLGHEDDSDDGRGNLRFEGHSDKTRDGLHYQLQSWTEKTMLTLSVCAQPVLDLSKPYKIETVMMTSAAMILDNQINSGILTTAASSSELRAANMTLTATVALNLFLLAS